MDIISLIRQLNAKATGSDGISTHMLLLCDESVVLPLKIIFSNILSTAIYPDTWKLANVTPIFKKRDKQLIKNYRSISLLPVSGGFRGGGGGEGGVAWPWASHFWAFHAQKRPLTFTPPPPTPHAFVRMSKSIR